jgi:hypothetical protein
MTGSIRELVTRLEAVVAQEIYRIWCGLHQLDLVMKYGYKGLGDGEFNDILHKLTGHLRYQFNLINEMQRNVQRQQQYTGRRWVQNASG